MTLFHTTRAVTATGGTSAVAAHKKTNTGLIEGKVLPFNRFIWEFTVITVEPELYLMLLQVLLLQLSKL